MALFTALAASAGISSVGNLVSSLIQKSSIDKGIEIQQQQLDLFQNLINEGKPLREALINAGLEAVPELLDFGLGTAGTGERFNRTLTRGTKDIFSGLSAYGLTDSSTAGTAVGDFTANLIASDEDRRLRVLSGLAGYQDPALSLGAQGSVGAAGSISDLVTSQGASTAGLYGSIGNTLAQLPLASELIKSSA